MTEVCYESRCEIHIDWRRFIGQLHCIAAYHCMYVCEPFKSFTCYCAQLYFFIRFIPAPGHLRLSSFPVGSKSCFTSRQ